MKPEADEPWYAVPLVLLCFLLFLLLVLELDSSLAADWSLELEPAAVPLSLDAPDFWPERVSAGVLVAFSWAAPDELIFDCALSSPVDFDEEAPLVSLELVPDDEVLGVEDEELPPFVEALLSLAVPEVDPDVPELMPDVPEVPAALLSFEDDELLEGDCELL